MSWYNGPLALMDTETTGVNVFTDRIVTACVILVPGRPVRGGSREPEVHSWLADPGVEIPEGASAIHGITTEHARQHGRPAPEVIEEFTSMQAMLMGNGIPLITMNGSYDLTILDRECERNSIESLSERLPYGVRPVVDVFVIDKAIPEERYRKGKRNLAALCDYYGVDIGQNAHDATADALAAGRVAWAICRKYPEIANMKLDELHDRQIEWKKEQSKSFATWLRREAGKETDPQERQRKLDDADAVSQEWPFVSRPVPAVEPEMPL